jgi:hypothetical protein
VWRAHASNTKGRTPSFTIDTYQHVLPGMQADAARVFLDVVSFDAQVGREKSEKTR